MKLTHHLLQGVIVAAVVLVLLDELVLNGTMRPSFWSVAFLLFPFFIPLGSIYPDADYFDSFKIRCHNKFALILSIVARILAYPLHYLIYKPTYIFLKRIVPQKYNELVRNEHRNVNHTILGITLASVIFCIMINFMPLVLSVWFKEYTFVLMGAAISVGGLMGFWLGAFMHLMQDAYSKSGIKLLQPFSEFRISGDYKIYQDKDVRDRIMSFSFYAALGALVGFLEIFNFDKVFPVAILTIVSLFLFYGVIFNLQINYNDQTRKLKMPLCLLLALLWAPTAYYFWKIVSVFLLYLFIFYLAFKKAEYDMTHSLVKQTKPHPPQ